MCVGVVGQHLLLKECLELWQGLPRSGIVDICLQLGSKRTYISDQMR